MKNSHKTDIILVEETQTTFIITIIIIDNNYIDNRE